jgi:toxin HigB-1
LIDSFGNKTAEDIASGKFRSNPAKKLPPDLHRRAEMLLDVMDASSSLSPFKVPRKNDLHKLKGSLKDYWSVTIKKPWAIIFKFKDGIFSDVKILDYH